MESDRFIYKCPGERVWYESRLGRRRGSSHRRHHGAAVAGDGDYDGDGGGGSGPSLVPFTDAAAATAGGGGGGEHDRVCGGHGGGAAPLLACKGAPGH